MKHDVAAIRDSCASRNAKHVCEMGTRKVYKAYKMTKHCTAVYNTVWLDFTTLENYYVWQCFSTRDTLYQIWTSLTQTVHELSNPPPIAESEIHNDHEHNWMLMQEEATFLIAGTKWENIFRKNGVSSLQLCFTGLEYLCQRVLNQRAARDGSTPL